MPPTLYSQQHPTLFSQHPPTLYSLPSPTLCWQHHPALYSQHHSTTFLRPIISQRPRSANKRTSSVPSCNSPPRLPPWHLTYRPTGGPVPAACSQSPTSVDPAGHFVYQHGTPTGQGSLAVVPENSRIMRQPGVSRYDGWWIGRCTRFASERTSPRHRSNAGVADLLPRVEPRHRSRTASHAPMFLQRVRNLSSSIFGELLPDCLPQTEIRLKHFQPALDVTDSNQKLRWGRNPPKMGGFAKS